MKTIEVKEIYADLLEKIPFNGLHILDKWFEDENPENRNPYIFNRILDNSMKIMIELWVNTDDEIINEKVKDAMNGILQIKSDLELFIPKNNELN